MSILKRLLPQQQGKYSRSGFYTLILAIYFGVIIISFIDYSHQLELRKQEIISQYYEIIHNHSIVKLNIILRQIPSKTDSKDIVLEIRKSDIVACNKKQCVKNNLFGFSSIIDKYIPEHIYYRIDLNKHLLHRNVKVEHYQLEKNYHIDNLNQLSIFITLDLKFQKQLAMQISKLFVTTSISLTLALLVVIIMYRAGIKNADNYYYQYYKDEISAKEKELMKKIWNLEYKSEKDKELNRIFSKKAGELALALHNQERNKNNTQEDLKYASCSIILYQKNKESEEINISTLMSDFSDRFSHFEDNITITFSSSAQAVRFTSGEFLYQIIYSTISYIVFMLKEQRSTNNYQINCYILKDSEGVASLMFHYNGLPIRNEQELMKLTNAFLQTNANPFCIGINQIFHILRQNDFECLVGYDNVNYIQFLKSPSIKKESENNNIIKFKK